jgi:hypothetical protein
MRSSYCLSVYPSVCVQLSVYPLNFFRRLMGSPCCLCVSMYLPLSLPGNGLLLAYFPCVSVYVSPKSWPATVFCVVRVILEESETYQRHCRNLKTAPVIVQSVEWLAYELDDRGFGIHFVEGVKFLLHSVEIGSGDHPVACLRVTGGSFPEGKVVWTWSWPLTSTYCRMYGTIPPFPSICSWHGIILHSRFTLRV